MVKTINNVPFHPFHRDIHVVQHMPIDATKTLAPIFLALELDALHELLADAALLFPNMYSQKLIHAQVLALR